MCVCVCVCDFISWKKIKILSLLKFSNRSSVLLALKKRFLLRAKYPLSMKNLLTMQVFFYKLYTMVVPLVCV